MQTDFSYNDEKFADIQMLRYQVHGFEQLTLRQKELIYYLSEAALSGRDILWDQNSKYNLRIRQTLESIYTCPACQNNKEEFKAFTVYLKRVWFSNGIIMAVKNSSRNSANHFSTKPSIWFRLKNYHCLTDKVSTNFAMNLSL